MKKKCITHFNAKKVFLVPRTHTPIDVLSTLIFIKMSLSPAPGHYGGVCNDAA